MKSAKKIIPFPLETSRRDREELEFLPAALEIVETPASPAGRGIAWTIMAVFLVAVVWSCFGQLDIVATAAGKIIPSGKTKQIQPFETSVVRAIHIADGQHVKAGEVLIDLDPTINQADRDHLQHDLIVSELEVARLRAALTTDKDPQAEFHPPAGAAPEMINIQKQFLRDQYEEQRAKLAAIDGQRAQKAAERNTVAATIEKLQASLPVLKQRLDIRQTLYDHETGSKANYLEMLQTYVEQQKEIEVQRSHLQESEAALSAITQTRDQTASEYRRTRYTELVDAERKAHGFKEDLIKAQEKTRLQQLISPVDGTVQQLAVHTVGGVVTPAQVLLVIVPAETKLQIEATVSNHDIGFVREGQEAQIKIETFNFTRYGVLHGNVMSVSRDAILRDKGQDKSGGNNDGRGAEADSGDGRGQELSYLARVSLDRTQMDIEDRTVDLTPGMAVVVEIKTGSRRVISYLLSPLLKFKQQALRER
jgi:membrane fusion protein, hemolysin D